MRYVQIVRCEIPAYGKGYAVIYDDTSDDYVWHILYPSISAAGRDIIRAKHVVTKICKPWPKSDDEMGW